MVQRVVNAKANVGLQSSVIVWNLDFHYPKGHYFSNNTISKVQTQGLTAKESKPKDSKFKEL